MLQMKGNESCDYVGGLIKRATGDAVVKSWFCLYRACFHLPELKMAGKQSFEHVEVPSGEKAEGDSFWNAATLQRQKRNVRKLDLTLITDAHGVGALLVQLLGPEQYCVGLAALSIHTRLIWYIILQASQAEHIRGRPGTHGDTV